MPRPRRPTIVPEPPVPRRPVSHECIEGYSRPISWRNPLGLPAPLTWKQMIGAAVIDGAANFGVALVATLLLPTDCPTLTSFVFPRYRCAMYRTIKPGVTITMWDIRHNTIAGDCAVTVFIQLITAKLPIVQQGILTFVIASGMVHVDMRHGGIAAFPYPWPDTQFAVVEGADPDAATSRRSYLWRTFHQRHGLGRGLHFFSGSHVNDIFNFSLTPQQFAVRLFWSVWKGSVLSALYFLVLWPITIAIIAPIWGGCNMAHTWAPEAIKLVFGFLLGLLQNPICAMIALGSEDSVRDHRREVHDRNIREMEEAPPALNTEMERVVRPKSAHFREG
ncbi:hypothetical protein JCM10049v2_005879 [Rhodotorula toruloides]